MPVIVVSGQPGAGSSTIGRMLAEKLSLRFFSPGDFFKSHSMADNETDRMLDFWSKEGNKAGFHRKLDKLQRSLAAKGNIVMIGKLSIRMISGADFTVWLKAPLKIRAKRVAKRDSMPVQETQIKMAQREKTEREKWKEIYGFDYFEQEKEANLVIDVSGKTPEQILKVIMHEIK